MITKVTKLFTLHNPDVTALSPLVPRPELPIIESIGLCHNPVEDILQLELTGEEANVDEAARILLAHFTPEEDTPALPARLWNTIKTWFGS